MRPSSSQPSLVDGKSEQREHDEVAPISRLLRARRRELQQHRQSDAQEKDGDCNSESKFAARKRVNQIGKQKGKSRNDPAPSRIEELAKRLSRAKSKEPERPEQGCKAYEG